MRAVPLEGRGKEEAQGESGNNQVVHQGRGERETGKVVSSSFVFFSPFSPPFVLIPLLLLVFHTPPLLHFQNHIFILKSHSLLPLRHMAFLPAGVRQGKPRKALTQ